MEECKEMSYTERLKCLKLHSPKGRRLRGNLIETYKIFNFLEEIQFQTLFSLAKSDKTRNAEGKMYAEHCNTNRQKHSFGIRVACHWNILPTLFKNAPCINSFKNLLDSDTKFSELFTQYNES